MIVCPPYEELPTWNTLPADDARRQHAEKCPRCRSWWLEFQSFESDEAGIDESRVDEAVDRLRLPRRSGPRRRPLHWLVAASLPLVLGGVWWISALRSPEPVHWRGEVTTSPAPPFELEQDEVSFTLSAVSDRVVEVRWVWVDAGLDEIASRTWNTREGIEDRALPIPSQPQSARFWQLEWKLEDGSMHSGELNPLD